MKFHVYESPGEMSVGAAEWITTYIAERLKEQDRFTLLLSGGSTPKELYSLLATDIFQNTIQWTKVHVFFGDERFVPFEDERNNGKMAYDNLLRLVPIPRLQYHFISTNDDENEAAQKYEQLLREYFPGAPPSFDLALLGMGTDAHSLSLFPGTDVIHEKTRWVLPSRAPVEPVSRITLTAPLVNLSERIAFLVAGGSKAPAVHEVVDGAFNPDLYPSQIISRGNKNVHLFADREAMKLVTTYK